SCATQPPDIFFDGKKITNTTQQVVVGQPIQLFAMPTGDPPQSWSLNNNVPWEQVVVGGFVVDPSCSKAPPLPPLDANCTGTVTPLTAFTDPQTPKFYWVRPGSYTVNYNYVLSGSAGSTETTYMR